MTAPAAITGDYCDLRFIKGRKVAQIVIEIPIEAAGAFVNAFGTPQPDKSVPVALAKLQPSALKQAFIDSVALEEKPKGGRLAKQAGILCSTPLFRKFLMRDYPTFLPLDPKMAAEEIRTYCGVTSRAELDHNEEAAAKFRQLDREFVAWCSE